MTQVELCGGKMDLVFGRGGRSGNGGIGNRGGDLEAAATDQETGQEV